MRLIVESKKLELNVKHMKESISIEVEIIKSFIERLNDSLKEFDFDLEIIEKIDEDIYKIKNEIYSYKYRDEWLNSNLVFPGENENVEYVINAIYGTNKQNLCQIHYLGNIGIGTTSPQNLLDLKESLNILALELNSKNELTQFALLEKAKNVKSLMSSLIDELKRKLDQLINRAIILTTVLNNIHGQMHYELSLQEAIFFRL